MNTVDELGDATLANISVAVVPVRVRVKTYVSVSSMRESELMEYVTVVLVSPAAKFTGSPAILFGDE